MKWMETDQDYLRTGTAMGSCASHEHSLDFLLAYLSQQLLVEYSTIHTAYNLSYYTEALIFFDSFTLSFINYSY